VWESEYEALPTANIARVFPAMDLDPCVVPDTAPVAPLPGRKYALGVDIGRVHDHGAMVVQDDQGLVVWAERIPLNVSYEIQAERAALLARKWNTTSIVDASGGGLGGHAQQNMMGPDAVVSVYRSKIPNLREMAWNAASKEKMVQGLSVDLEQHRVRIPSQFRELVGEMEAYEFVLRTGGRYRYSAPSGKRDDLVSALLMANLAKRNRWIGQNEGKSLALAF
jgi:phage FluMu gp28-like protein